MQVRAIRRWVVELCYKINIYLMFSSIKISFETFKCTYIHNTRLYCSM